MSSTESNGWSPLERNSGEFHYKLDAQASAFFRCCDALACSRVCIENEEGQRPPVIGRQATLRLDAFDIITSTRVDFNEFAFVDKNWSLELTASFNRNRFANVGRRVAFCARFAVSYF